MTSDLGERPFRAPLAVLAAALLFNLGQGVLRPSMPLYLQRSFAANYRMVTLIPVVFGVGKWLANLPTGYLLGRFGSSLMICGLLLIACIDVASILTSSYGVFLALRAMGGVGWAMFATVATTAVVDVPAARRRGRAVSLLLMSETSGLLLGSGPEAGSTRTSASRAHFCSKRRAWSSRRSPWHAGRGSAPTGRRRHDRILRVRSARSCACRRCSSWV